MKTIASTENTIMTTPRTFHYTEAGSSKFWTIATSADGKSFTTTFGKIGASGQSKEKTFPTAEACALEAAKLIREKTGKGYIEQDGTSGNADDGSAPAATPAAKAVLETGETDKKPAAPKMASSATKAPETPEAADQPARQSTTLYYREGSSDKVYQAELIPAPDNSGYLVNASWGRRGSTLQTGSKTANPLPFEKALAIYNKLVAEKTAKGYSPGEDGTAYSGTDNAGRVSGLLPQLLNVIDDATLEMLIADPTYCAQPKLDGERRMIKESSIGVNRRGLTVPLPAPLENALPGAIRGAADLDGELVGDCYTVFDILSLDGRNLRTLPCSERLALLRQHVSPADKTLALIETACTADEKRALLKRLQDANQEGIVFKRLDAPYTHGRPATGGTQLKYKFCASATVCVTAQNEGKRSVVMGVIDGQETLREVGSVTIPANHTIPAVGTIVEVRYLYAYPQGSLFQPVYCGPRPDMDREDCVEGQLKYKAGND